MMQPWEKNGKLIEGDDGKPVECEECPCDQGCPEDCSGCGSTYTATLDANGGGAGTGCSYADGVPVTMTGGVLCIWAGVSGWVDDYPEPGNAHEIQAQLACANAEWGLLIYYKRTLNGDIVDECWFYLTMPAKACPDGAYSEMGGGTATAVVS